MTDAELCDCTLPVLPNDIVMQLLTLELLY